MIILGFTLEAPGLKRQIRPAVKAALNDTAGFWFQAIFPVHFSGRNRSKYGFEPRTGRYVQVLKPRFGQGQGKFVDLLLRGSSRRFMRFGVISGTANRATVTMKPPGYFVRPFVGSWTDRKTKQEKHISRQPDKPREATATTPEELANLRKFAGERVTSLLNAAGISNVTVIR